jgi:hypothetical protein
MKLEEFMKRDDQDKLVEMHVFGKVPCTGERCDVKNCVADKEYPDYGGAPRNFTFDIEAAWDVLLEVRKWPPMARRVFMETLFKTIDNRLGKDRILLDPSILGYDLLLNLEPMDIVIAVLIEMEVIER